MAVTLLNDVPKGPPQKEFCESCFVNGFSTFFAISLFGKVEDLSVMAEDARLRFPLAL